MRRNKYGNKLAVVDGIRFASQREARRYVELKLLQQAGEISDLKLQPRFTIMVNGVKVCTYTADFSYRNSRGEFVVEDVKGVRTRDYKLKKRLMLAVYGIQVVEV